MFRKTILIFTLLFLLFINAPKLVFASRPYSVPCYFEGEILSYKTIAPKTDLEEYELQISMTKISDTPECASLQGKTIQGNWFPPTAKLPSGELYKPNQPAVAPEDVLKQGTVIKGYIDSFDYIIEKVEIKKGKLGDNVIFIIVGVAAACVISLTSFVLIRRNKK